MQVRLNYSETINFLSLKSMNRHANATFVLQDDHGVRSTSIAPRRGETSLELPATVMLLGLASITLVPNFLTSLSRSTISRKEWTLD